MNIGMNIPFLMALGLSAFSSPMSGEPNGVAPEKAPLPDLKSPLVVQLEKQRHRLGEPIVVSSEFTNLGKDPLTLWSCGFWCNHLVVVADEVGREPSLTEEGVRHRERYTLHSGIRDRNRPIVVAPGKSHQTSPSIDLMQLYDLGPGRYRVVVIYIEQVESPMLIMTSDPATFVIEE